MKKLLDIDCDHEVLDEILMKVVQHGLLFGRVPEEYIQELIDKNKKRLFKIKKGSRAKP